jgi:3-oxoacyl-[acyl-carrier-protein] synthase II
MLVLESEEIARDRGANILGRVSGYGLSSDAWHITAPCPDGRGAQLSMQAALRNANLTPDQIDYVNAHATSTIAGDLAEAHALRAVFGRRSQSMPISSTKGQTGHLLGAAGALEAVISILSILNSSVPPNANLQHLDPAFSDLFLPTKPITNQPIHNVMSNSFGFGGTNVTLIFSSP